MDERSVTPADPARIHASSESERELRPRPWPHDREDCSTCVTYALLTDRRRRMEIAGLKRAQRIIDLRDEEDVAWVRAHAHAHRDWQSYRETEQ